MLSLEEQIGRIADHAMSAIEAEPTVVLTRDLRGRSRRAAIASAVLAAAAAVTLVVVLGTRDRSVTPDGGSTSAGTTTTVPVSTATLPDSQPVTVTGAPLPGFDSTLADPALGMAAPVLDGKDFQGNQVTIDGRTNGATLVVFLAHWCPHCNREVPRLNEWRQSGQVPAGLRVVGVITAVSRTSVNYPPAQWIVDKAWQWPVMVDQSKGDGAAGVAAEAYGAAGWPYFVLVGADGKVKWRESGELEITDLQKSLEAALGASPTDTSTSVPAATRPSWAGLKSLPDSLANIPLPPKGTIELHGADGRVVSVTGTDTSVCVLVGPQRGGGCTGPASGPTISWMGGSESSTADGVSSPVFHYWLVRDGVTVRMVDTQGRSVCTQGPARVQAYPGVSLWTCLSDSSVKNVETRTIVFVDTSEYVLLRP
jgi:thiol-disulfide isomerase/thioredoxin